MAQSSPDWFPLPKGRSAPDPAVQRPLALLTFSYTPSHVLVFDDSALRYYKDPPPNAPLARDYENWIKRPEERGRLDALLQCLAKEGVKKEAKRADLITWRGIMTKIITAPYESRDGWDLNVMLVGGNMFLEEHLTAERLQDKENMTPQHRLFSYYGYAFESYCTADQPPDEAMAVGSDGWGGTVNTNVQWCTVVKTKISDLRIILGAEVDCVRDTFTGQPDTFVELKTSMVIRNDRDSQNFRTKLLKFWAQSFLLGIPEIVVGFRTREGLISTVQSFKTLELPGIVKGQSGEWSAAVCLDFGARFIQYLREYIEERRNGPGDERRVWRVRFQPGVGMNIGEVTRAELDDIVGGEDRVGFLPTSYFSRHSSI